MYVYNINIWTIYDILSYFSRSTSALQVVTSCNGVQDVYSRAEALFNKSTNNFTSGGDGRYGGNDPATTLLIFTLFVKLNS